MVSRIEPWCWLGASIRDNAGNTDALIEIRLFFKENRIGCLEMIDSDFVGCFCMTQVAWLLGAPGTAIRLLLVCRYVG